MLCFYLLSPRVSRYLPDLTDFWLNILLTILGWIPGVLHAWYVTLLSSFTFSFPFLASSLFDFPSFRALSFSLSLSLSPRLSLPSSRVRILCECFGGLFLHPSSPNPAPVLSFNLLPSFLRFQPLASLYNTTKLLYPIISLLVPHLHAITNLRVIFIDDLKLHVFTHASTFFR